VQGGPGEESPYPAPFFRNSLGVGALLALRRFSQGGAGGSIAARGGCRGEIAPRPGVMPGPSGGHKKVLFPSPGESLSSAWFMAGAERTPGSGGQDHGRALEAGILRNIFGKSFLPIFARSMAPSRYAMLLMVASMTLLPAGPPLQQRGSSRQCQSLPREGIPEMGGEPLKRLRFGGGFFDMIGHTNYGG